jgi:YegS/Rv2252/BmrU family lipid kinase
MPDRKLLYIINPISGTRNKGALQDLIRHKTEKAELHFDIISSIASGDYSGVAATIQQEGITDVIIAGGDGTVNTALHGLKHTGVQFGILPCGSGNGLAFSAGMPKSLDKSLNIIFNGRSDWTDAFLVNGKFACMLCGIGFDAQVAHDFANDPKRGLTTYIRKTVSNFFISKPYHFVLETGGKTIETDAFFISLANSNQFGNNFTIAPQASLTDGMLDIVIVTRQGKLSMMFQTLLQVGGFNHLKTLDGIDEKAGVLYFQADHLVLHNTNAAPMHIDGDPAETAERIELKMLKSSFRLIYP